MSLYRLVLRTAGVTALTSTPPSLEELFLRHYGDEPRVVELRERARPLLMAPA